MHMDVHGANLQLNNLFYSYHWYKHHRLTKVINFSDSGHFSDLSDVDLDESSVLHSEGKPIIIRSCSV